MHRLHIDIETFSDISLVDAGVYRYVESPNFDILLFGYSLDGMDVKVIDLTEQDVSLPGWLVRALTSPEYIKVAHNASFEMACLSRYLGTLMVPHEWRDTAFMAYHAGLPGSLAGVGTALGFDQDKAKDRAGKDLIRYFSIPCRPTKSNGGRTRNLPEHAPEKWAQYIEYNRQDVVAEMEVDRILSAIPIPEWLQTQWEEDIEINRRGTCLDRRLVYGALHIADVETARLTRRAVEITGLENPNSVAQMRSWLASRGVQTDDLTKDTVSNLLRGDGLPDDVREALSIRQELGKSSVKKYERMRACVCDDDRVRGLLQFYGANRTGRFAGRLIQVQNLPRTYTKEIELARALVEEGNATAVRLLYGSAQDTLSQLIRTALVATPGNVLVDADFSAIEARVVAWLAGEEWTLQAFRDGKDIYCETASMMYHVPVEKHGANKHLRQKGKIATLACGYMGGVGAMKAMDPSGSIPEEEMQSVVDQWREANPHIVMLWNDLQNAAVAIISGQSGPVTIQGKVTLAMEYVDTARMFFLTALLPSGRKLYYPEPRIGQNRFGGTSITYLGTGEQKKWMRLETYGGKICENLVQAIARDCLCDAIDRLVKAGYPIVFHVHDEVVIDMPPGPNPQKLLDDVVRIMSEPISWAPGLPLDAAGWVGDFFTKD